MERIDKPSSSPISIGGIFSYYCMPIKINEQFEKIILPQSFTQFPIIMLLSCFISNSLKLAIPFTLEYLYLNLDLNNVIQPLIIFVFVIILNYYFQLKSQNTIHNHCLKVKQILCRRVIRFALRAPYQNFASNSTNSSSKKNSWSKITGNISIFVHNYYGSYIAIVFQTLKAIVIVGYLFSKIGWITVLGLFISGIVVQFTGLLSQKIQNAKFKKLLAIEQKTKILTQYFSRIVDYQMSWLDGFIGDRIDAIQKQHQKNLRRTKLLDAWCVGLWQFTQICISSIVLCVFYFYYASSTKTSQNLSFINQLQPATIIYLFQMLTFPMNAISWNIAGLNNAQRALRELTQSERNVEVEKKKIKAIQKFDFGYEITSIIKHVKQGKIYAVFSEDADVFKKLALCLSNLNKQNQKRQVSYAEQNGFLLPTLFENLYMEPKQEIKLEKIKNDLPNLVKIFRLCKFEQFPAQNNNISTYSGGQKMRLSLIRAFLNGKYILIDSDLTSLDKSTRNNVLANFKEYVASHNDVCIIIKGKKGDQQLEKIVEDLIEVQTKFSRVKFKPSKYSANGKMMKKNILTQKSPFKQRYFKSKDKFKQIQMQKEKQKNNQTITTMTKQQAQKKQIETKQQMQILHEKLFLYISNQLSYEQSISKQENSRIPTMIQPKLRLNLKTLNFYFCNKFYHILFVLSLGGMYCVGNYYNYFVNVNKPEDPYQYGYTIMKITLIYIIFIALRSVTFAIANLKQSKRISILTNKLTIFNHISFYDKLNLIDHEPQPDDQTKQLKEQPIQRRRNKNLATQKLVCLSTSDLKTINDSFPFSTNILWNNIATVTGSLIMVFLQVPVMIIFTILFVLLIRKLQESYRTNNQILVCNSKDQQIRLMKAVNNIEQGSLYIQVYGKKQKFIKIFNEQLRTNIQLSNQQNRLSIWVKSNFRFNMVIFLILSVGLFWANYAFFAPALSSQGSTSSNSSQNNGASTLYEDQNTKQSAKMSVMLRYILLLADYIFYLTMSLSECRGQALSIERIRRHAENQKTINDSFKRIQQSNNKKQSLIKSLKQNQNTQKKQFINLSNFSYHYSKFRKQEPPVLDNINLQVKYGDKIMLKGQTGAGKTTLFKVLMGLYPQIYFPDKTFHLLSFSSQHPLKMGDCSVLQKVDPYQILEIVPQSIKNAILQKCRKIIEKQEQNKKKRAISYEDQIVINNLRAYLYGFKGLALYDEPHVILNEKQVGSYVVVTHHREFASKKSYLLAKGKLYSIKESS